MTVTPMLLFSCALSAGFRTASAGPAQGTAAASRTHASSVYTSLDPKACKTTRVDREAGGSEQVCPGFGGFRLRVEDDDARAGLTLLGPEGRLHPLDLSGVVSPNFSSLGPRAEWRVRLVAGRAVPIALTVRLNVSEDPARPTAICSYLAVVRVGAEPLCVVKVIRSSASALEEARVAADTAGRMPCLAPGTGAR